MKLLIILSAITFGMLVGFAMGFSIANQGKSCDLNKDGIVDIQDISILMAKVAK